MTPSSPGADAPSDWPPSIHRERLPFRLRLWLPNTRTALRSGVRRVSTLARSCGYESERRADLEIALTEALANAMKHGNHSRPRGKVFLRSYGGPEAGLVVVVRDQGGGFDPEAVPDPRGSDRLELHHGRGLLLMRSLTDHLEYRKGGREVVLILNAASG